MDDLRLTGGIIDCLSVIRDRAHGELRELARGLGLIETQTGVLWKLRRERGMTARRLAGRTQC
ncbi:hypothetical protein [Streptomyces oceani]|uniref:hypothetical protein n=1 Tax=Streptomyces oceani TaxID=1075402 RepID=UPI000871B45E|nr:hypothetical protein [Streptomyces oceani]